MNKIYRIVAALAVLTIAVGILAFPMNAKAAGTDEEAAVAVESNENSVRSSKAIGAAIAIGLAACGGALGMGISIAKSAEGMSRQPEAAGKIQTAMMLGLVFVETAIIYALVVAILIVFVL